MARIKSHENSQDSDSETNTALASKLRARIQEAGERLTPRQQALADYITRNPESLAFSGITKLSEESGISQATIVRFARKLGFGGYSDLVRHAQQQLQSELGTVGRFRLVHRDRETRQEEGGSSFERVVSQEMENLVRLIRNVRREDFYHCVDRMEKADRIFIIGCMGDAILATFFSNMLSKIYTDVELITGEDPVTPSRFTRMSEASLAFVIAFPRYPRETVKWGKLVSKNGGQLVTITDAPLFPLAPSADLAFFLPIGITSFVDAYASPVALINALVTELSERNPERTQQSLLEYDACVSEADLFVSVGRQRNGPNG
jgi:DNA-binding MurR/RpiR family transcriptional regulator